VQHKLTPIESLLGGGGKKNNSILILGLLVQIEEGKYYLEDLTGQVPVVFQDSIEVDGFFVTEQCILLVEGIFYDGHFYVDRLGNPLLETRETSLHAIQQQISHPYFAPRKNGVKNESLSFVILSDVCMDHPRVSQKLESIFAKFDKHSPLDIPCFILMGNFCTPHAHLIQQQHQMTQYSSSYNRTANAIDELVTLIEKFPNLSQHAHFCLIPGPTDYAVLGSAHLHVLPLPPITKVMRSTLSSINNRNVANLHHGSNPCRIRWAGKEIVIFRHDLLHLFQQNEVLGQKFNSTAVTDVDLPMSLDLDTNHHRLPQCRLVKTILDQGHLLPFPNQPLYWNYDSSLRLYPIPDAIILGGGGQTVPFHEVYGGCNVVHPGSLMNAALSNANTPTSSYAHFTLDKDSRSSQESDVDASSVDFLD
jgi:DNA polymerase epsilon subunit 2